MKSAVCARSFGSRLLAGTQPADRLTVLSLVVSSLCRPRTAWATESGRTTVGWVRSIAWSCFCIVAVAAASASASAGDAAAGVVGSGGVPAGPVVGERLVARRLGSGWRGAGVGEALLGQHAEPDERRGGVILPEIGPHAVDAAVVHQVGFLEAALAGRDIVGGHDHIAGAIRKGLRMRRRLLVGEHRRPAQQREANYRGDQQYPFQDVADWIDRRTGKVLCGHVRLPPGFAGAAFPPRAFLGR